MPLPHLLTSLEQRHTLSSMEEVATKQRVMLKDFLVSLFHQRQYTTLVLRCIIWARSNMDLGTLANKFSVLRNFATILQQHLLSSPAPSALHLTSLGPLLFTVGSMRLP
mmetsp:Transcript_2379/g.3723  ORF Transcript_2379/g.3723 Transcript_2379/m.3723 type:complete len:109 (-) Transcript_2379:1226-1552(-)